MTIRNRFALVAMLGAFAIVGKAQIKHIEMRVEGMT
jgi:hypothetical protein